MDPVTEGDVIRELVEFAIDRDLSRVVPGIRNKRYAVARRYHRIWNHVIPVEEKLQDDDGLAKACAKLTSQGVGLIQSGRKRWSRS